MLDEDTRRYLVYGETSNSGDDAFGGVCGLFRREVDDEPAHVLGRSHKLPNAIEALKKMHPEPYDPEHACKKKLEAWLGREVESPIRRSEDDRQYADRVAGAKKSVESFQRAMSQPDQATTDDMLVTCRTLSDVYWVVAEPGTADRPGPTDKERAKASSLWEKARDRAQTRRTLGRRPRNEQEPSEEENNVNYCRRMFLTKLTPWVAARYADHQKGRNEEKAQGERARRQTVLDRRFSPIEEECARTWSESEKCQSLDGLEADEREQCKKRCTTKRQEAFTRAVKEAHDTCVEQFVSKGGKPNCELKKPDKSTIEEAAIRAAITTCTADCRKDGPDAKAEAQRREQAERESRRAGTSTSKAPASRSAPSNASCCAKCGGSWVASPGACTGGDNLCFMCCAGTAPASACGGR